MGALTLTAVTKSFGTTDVIKGVDLERAATASSASSSAPRAAASPRCCASSPGWRTRPSGDILIDGKRVNDVAPAKREIAMVFQTYALYPHLTVRDNMGLALKQAGAPKAEIDARVDRRRRHAVARPAARPPPGRALRRPAPARRHRPRHRAHPEAVPVRRAAVEPRRRAARRHPDRDRPPAPRARRRR